MRDNSVLLLKMSEMVMTVEKHSRAKEPIVLTICITLTALGRRLLPWSAPDSHSILLSSVFMHISFTSKYQSLLLLCCSLIRRLRSKLFCCCRMLFRRDARPRQRCVVVCSLERAKKEKLSSPKISPINVGINTKYGATRLLKSSLRLLHDDVEETARANSILRRSYIIITCYFH